MTLRVGVYPADRGGCGHYRMLFPAAAARDNDVHVDVKIDSELEQFMCEWPEPFDGDPMEHHVPTAIISGPDIDVAVFQRPLNAQWKHVFPLLKECGITVVVDMDDNFDRIHRGNVAWYTTEPHWMLREEMQELANAHGRVHATRASGDRKFVYCPTHGGKHHKGHLNEALAHADIITCSTQSLATHYAKYAPTVVLRNCVPEAYLRLRENVDLRNSPMIGWTGSVITHPGDLRVMGGALTALRRTDEFTFGVVGTGYGVKAECGLAPDVTTEWVPIEEYPREYAQLDIALCPLEDNAFNRGKSWLKPLEATAVGAIPVMSNLPEYNDFAFQGAGYTVRRPREWESTLRRLLRMSEDERQEQRERGYEAASKLTYEKNAWRWLEVWSQAHEHRRRTSVSYS